MGKKRKRAEAIEADSPDLTPMIDITFQLVVFFLVANDLTRKEIEELELPQAIAGGEDKGEDQRIIINIIRPKDINNPDKHPTIKVKGRSYDLKKLGRFMKTQADKKREDPGGPGAPSAVFVPGTFWNLRACLKTTTDR